MKTIAFLSQKGGSGKSTLAISLACKMEEEGKQVLLVDTDAQATIYKWSKFRISDAPYVISVQPVALEETLKKYKKAGADLAIVDTAGHTSSAAINIIKHADLIIIPSRATTVDTNAIGESVNIVKLLGNKDVFILFNAVHHNANTLFEEVKELVEKSFDVQVMPFYITQRSAYSHGLIDGGSPLEFQLDIKVDQEMNRLYEFVSKKLNI